MRTCDVSVIVPNYNRTTSLLRAVMSISIQTLPPREVIIIDDGSDDDTIKYCCDLLRLFSDSLSIRMIRIDRNQGANFCRNTGIHSAGSKYVAFLDSDDMWFPKKLEKQMGLIESAMTTDRRPVLSGTGRYRVTGRGEIIARQYGASNFNAYDIRVSNIIGTLSSVVVETSVARTINGFDESLPACQDWDFFIRIASYVQYVGTSEPLCVYVDHTKERISSGHKKRIGALLAIYGRHIKGSIAPADEASFYRVIAEGLQEIGRHRLSRYLYARHLVMKHLGDGFRSKTLVAAIGAISSVISSKSLKERRYQRYRRGFKRKMLNPSFRHEVVLHQKWIDSLMSEQTLR